MPGVVHQTKDWKPTPRGHDHKPIRNPFEPKEKYWGKVKAWKDREAARKRGEHPRLPGQVVMGGGGHLARPPAKPPHAVVKPNIKPHTIADVIPGGKHSANPSKPAPKPKLPSHAPRRDAILTPHGKPLHEVMKEHGMKPPTVHTEIKHNVVGTNTRGASVFLKGATAPSQDKKN